VPLIGYQLIRGKKSTAEENLEGFLLHSTALGRRFGWTVDRHTDSVIAVPGWTPSATMLLHFFPDGSPSPVTAFFASHHARTDPFSRGFQGSPSRLALSHASCRSLAQFIVQQQQQQSRSASLPFPSDITGSRYDVIRDPFFSAKVTRRTHHAEGRTLLWHVSRILKNK
jgi:hypothetical protein